MIDDGAQGGIRDAVPVVWQFMWRESVNDLAIYFPISDAVRARDIVIEISRGVLRIEVKNEKFTEELLERVIADELTWYIDGDDDDDDDPDSGRVVVVEIPKKEPGLWGCPPYGNLTSPFKEDEEEAEKEGEIRKRKKPKKKEKQKAPKRGFGKPVLVKRHAPVAVEDVGAQAEKRFAGAVQSELDELHQDKEAQEKFVKRMLGSFLKPEEEMLPSQRRAIKPESRQLSIPIESKLVAREDRKQPGTVYKYLELSPRIDNTSAVKMEVAKILMPKLPAWWADGNEWFSKGDLSLRTITFHITVTPKMEDLTPEGKDFLDNAGKLVLSGREAELRQVKSFFIPRQVKMIPVRRFFREERDVAWILLLGDILVKASGNLLWKQVFHEDSRWSPHITILALSVSKQLLADQLRTKSAVVKFHREVKASLKNKSDSILFDGQQECLPLVTALMGKDGIHYMSEVDQKIDRAYSSGLKEAERLFRRAMIVKRRKGGRTRPKRKR